MGAAVLVVGGGFAWKQCKCTRLSSRVEARARQVESRILQDPELLALAPKVLAQNSCHGPTHRILLYIPIDRAEAFARHLDDNISVLTALEQPDTPIVVQYYEPSYTNSDLQDILDKARELPE